MISSDLFSLLIAVPSSGAVPTSPIPDSGKPISNSVNFSQVLHELCNPRESSESQSRSLAIELNGTNMPMQTMSSQPSLVFPKWQMVTDEGAGPVKDVTYEGRDLKAAIADKTIPVSPFSIADVPTEVVPPVAEKVEERPRNASSAQPRKQVPKQIGTTDMSVVIQASALTEEMSARSDSMIGGWKQVGIPIETRPVNAPDSNAISRALVTSGFDQFGPGPIDPKLAVASLPTNEAQLERTACESAPRTVSELITSTRSQTPNFLPEADRSSSNRIIVQPHRLDHRETVDIPHWDRVIDSKTDNSRSSPVTLNLPISESNSAVESNRLVEVSRSMNSRPAAKLAEPSATFEIREFSAIDVIPLLEPRLVALPVKKEPRDPERIHVESSGDVSMPSMQTTVESSQERDPVVPRPVEPERNLTWQDATRYIGETAPKQLERDGQVEFHFRISPPEMGPIRIRLATMHGSVTAELTVANEAIQHLVESRMPELRDRLETAGVVVSGFEIRQEGGAASNPRHHNPDVWRREPDAVAGVGSNSSERANVVADRHYGLIDVNA